MSADNPDDEPHGECQVEIDRLYGAVHNCWLYAARHRREEWANPILEFCKAAGFGSPLRSDETGMHAARGRLPPGASPGTIGHQAQAVASSPEASSHLRVCTCPGCGLQFLPGVPVDTASADGKAAS